MPFVITITGPSGSGKSTAVRYIQERGPDFNIAPTIIPRYTTRTRRSDDGPDLLSVPRIPRECDLVYEQYGVRYGLNSRALFGCLADGGTPIVIVNDVRVVADIKAMLGPLTKCLFIFRSFPRIAEFIRLAVERGVPDAESEAERRLDKSDAIYRIYIENIHLFDHVLINAGTLDALRSEVEVVVRGFAHAQRVWPLRRSLSATVPVE